MVATPAHPMSWTKRLRPGEYGMASTLPGAWTGDHGGRCAQSSGSRAVGQWPFEALQARRRSADTFGSPWKEVAHAELARSVHRLRHLWLADCLACRH